jgi:hypothetical protein
MNAPGSQHSHSGHGGENVVTPAATAAPMVVALGVTLMAAGCVTSWVMSGLGAVMILSALAAWAAQLLPGRGEVEQAWVPIEQRPQPVEKAIVAVEARPPGFIRRMQVPAQIHPYSSGVRGGVVGGAAMAVVALAYGLASGRGIWYPVNLLAAMLMPAFADSSDAELQQFDALALGLGLVIHALVSAGAGLIYGVLLPTLPRWPVLWGGIVAPLLWTGGIHSFMGVLNPVMNARVDWPWFIASQVVYGLAAGLVVVHSKTISIARRVASDRGPPADSS